MSLSVERKKKTPKNQQEDPEIKQKRPKTKRSWTTEMSYNKCITFKYTQNESWLV